MLSQSCLALHAASRLPSLVPLTSAPENDINHLPIGIEGPHFEFLLANFGEIFEISSSRQHEQPPAPQKQGDCLPC